MRLFTYPIVAAALWLLPASCGALTIDLVFSDTSPFATNVTARNSIQQAAADISAAITSALSPVNDYQWTRSTTSGSQTLNSTYTWKFSYSTPTQGNVDITPNLSANKVEFYVRGQDISGGTLGIGGAAGIGYSSSFNISYVGSINQTVLQSQFTTLVNQQSGLAESEFTRGAGPVIGTLGGVASINLGGNVASASYEVAYGPAYGTLALDTSTGSKTFDQYWHTNYATPVAAGKNDLYSVALHEMLHALGYGASDTWNNAESGTTWTGAEAILENGTGTNLVSGAHVAEGTMSRRITDGAAQEAVMDPTLTVGTRKYLTTLDLAFLRDLGYSTILPEFGLDGDFNDDGMVDLADYTVWRDNLGASSETALSGNGSGNGIVDSADYALWKSNFGAAAAGLQIAASTHVPEPAAGGILLSATVVSLFLARVSRQCACRVQ